MRVARLEVDLPGSRRRNDLASTAVRSVSLVRKDSPDGVRLDRFMHRRR